MTLGFNHCHTQQVNWPDSSMPAPHRIQLWWRPTLHTQKASSWELTFSPLFLLLWFTELWPPTGFFLGTKERCFKVGTSHTDGFSFKIVFHLESAIRCYHWNSPATMPNKSGIGTLPQWSKASLSTEPQISNYYSLFISCLILIQALYNPIYWYFDMCGCIQCRTMEAIFSVWVVYFILNLFFSICYWSLCLSKSLLGGTEVPQVHWRKKKKKAVSQAKMAIT